MNKNVSISVLVPTLNADRVLDKCFNSIRNQDYPKNKLEIIVADGGSTDNTLKIARQYGAKIYQNVLKTGETGKAVALKRAKSELVALIDSDNYLPDKDWLVRMVAPFSDPDILGSEPWMFTYRKNDPLINRYCALIGMNDPYCYFVGNYDRYSYLSGKWTGLRLDQEDKKCYFKVKMFGKVLPTIGANGTFWRTEVLRRAVGKSKYLFDTDIPYVLSRNTPFYFAKVKVSIIHDFCPTIKDFYRKQKRRVGDFYYLERCSKRNETYQRQPLKQAKFILSSVLVFPLVFQSLKGYRKKRDRAWAFHPAAVVITLWVYGVGTILGSMYNNGINRDKWKQ